MLLDFFLNNYYAAYLLVIVTVLFGYFASSRVSSIFRKYNDVHSRNNVPANVIVRQILDSYGLYDVSVVHISGDLSDHYDVRRKVVALSDSTFYSTSVAAIGIVAHEAGHAVQHAQGYIPIRIRNFFAPVASIGSKAWFFLFIAGIFLSMSFLVDAGIILFAFIVLFQLLTLPVEFNASRRALDTIKSQNLLESDEIVGAEKTLSAAAMTYVASLMVSLAQLLRLLSGRRR